MHDPDPSRARPADKDLDAIPPPRRDPPSVVGLATSAVLVLSGCSGSSSDPAPTANPTSTTAGTGGAGAGTGVSPTDLPTTPGLKNPQGAVVDVSYGTCATAAGTRKLSGTIKNSTSKSADFVITMSWTNATYDVLGRGVAVVEDVAAGKTKKWSMSAKVASGATTCTPNVLRGTLTKAKTSASPSPSGGRSSKKS